MGISMYQFFSKLGYKKRYYEWFPILIVRVGLGISFILSGFFKLFNSNQHMHLLQILQDANISLPEFNVYLIPLLELIGGIFILIGFLCSLTSLILFLITILALIINRVVQVASCESLITFENFLYLPEVLHTLMLFWLFFSGQGKVSLDYTYGKKKCLSNSNC